METMTTPNGNKNTKPRTANTLADELRTEPGISVYELRFRGTPGPDLPLKRLAVNGGVNILRARDGVLEIAYLPRMQFYRIVEKQLGGLADVVCYCPREWATFEPMP